MLDQNTDRMWYVIGAVIVGAAIIFLANGTLPNLFASVSESFEERSSSAVEVVDAIHLNTYGNMIDGLEYGRWIHERSGVYGVASDSDSFAITGYIPVEGGLDYTFRTASATYNKRVAYYEQLSSGEYVFIEGYKNRNIANHSINEEVVALTTTAPMRSTHVRLSTMYKEHVDPERAALGYDVPENWWFGQAR